MVSQQPSGIVAFLFTDVENSTAMWDQLGNDMASRLEAHDLIMRDVIGSLGGYVFSTAGDSFAAAFSSTTDALEAGSQIQQALADSSDAVDIRVRMGIHSGEASLRDGDYFGPSVNRAARIMSLGHGGQILVSETSASLVGDGLSAFQLTELGLHSLAGFETPERIFQADVAGDSAQFPPLRSTSAVRNNLPEQPTPFIGRDVELSEIAELLESSRVVSVVAAGGCGKSRLGIELGKREGYRFKDGVFFVPLAARSAPEEVPEAIAESLGISSVAATDTMSQVIDFLAAKQQLVILDNFEHVKAAGTYVSTIIENAPDVSILVTSRSRLGLRGESVYPLGGLQAGWETAEEAMSLSGPKLFLDSARRRDPAFELSDEDLEDLQSLLRLVDGNPLAIEIAASWVDVLPVSEIATEISANVDFLESEMSDAPDRHRSIRAVFDYSWRTLTDRERMIFPRLSVFRGGFTREAAQEVAGASLRDLSGLADKSLLRASRATGRFTTHELLRQYADRYLDEAGEVEVVADAHAQFFSTVAASAFDAVRSGGQMAAIAKTEADLDNLRSGFRRCADNDPDAARRYLECLWFIHEVRSWYPAGRDLFAEAAAIARKSTASGSDRLAALSQAQQAWYLSLMGSAEDGLKLATAAHKEVMATDPAGADACLAQQSRNIGLLFLNPEGIRDGTEEAMSLALRDGDEWWRMTLSAWEAYAYIADPGDSAVQISTRAIEYFSSIGDYWVQVWPLGLIGIRAEQRGDLNEARQSYEQALAIGRSIDFGRIIQYMLNSLGRVTTAQGDFEQAEDYLAEGLVFSLDGGQEREILAGLVDIAAVRIGQERWAEATELLVVVGADPMRTQRTAFAVAPIVELADQLEAKVADAIGSEGFEELRRAATPVPARDAAVAVVAEPAIGAGSAV